MFNKPFGHFKGCSQGETATTDIITQKPSKTSGIFTSSLLEILQTTASNIFAALLRKQKLR